MRPFGKYLLVQVPGWLLAAGVLAGLESWAGLPLWAAAGLLALWVVKDLVMYPLVRPAYETGVKTGVHELIGAPGVVQESLGPGGSVKVRGELWTAEAHPSEPPIPAGAPVRVEGARGLTLIVVRDDAGLSTRPDPGR